MERKKGKGKTGRKKRLLSCTGKGTEKTASGDFGKTEAMERTV